MADRYWVGGTAFWDGTAGTKWATTSGGAGGASTPSAADRVFFDANSGSGVVTVGATVSAGGMDFTGFTGTYAGSSGVNNYGDLTASATMTWTNNGFVQFIAASGTRIITTAGKTVCALTFSNSASSATFNLADALTSSGVITVTGGTFTTNNFNVTAASLSSSNSNTRTINLGSSTVTLSASSGAINFITNTNLTFNAGTSSIVLTNASATFAGGSQTFNDVSFTSTSGSTHTLSNNSTFNNLSFAGRTSAGIASVQIGAGQTINGTLTLSAGTNATCRTFVRSNTIGTTRTLTCANVASLQDIDFRDITIAGAAAPVSGTRLGDCKGNSGITFPAPKTVYWNLAAGGNWSATGWATTGGGTPAVNNFPLAQDTAIFQSTGLNSAATVTVNAAYNIGTIDMSARTSNTMTLATGSTTPTIYGNWVNGTGTTLSGTGVLAFAGRGSQTITSAGVAFTQPITVDTIGGSVTLQDAFIPGRNTSSALILTSGTFNANGYNVTFSGSTSGMQSSGTATRAISFGSGTWTFAGASTPFTAASTGLTVTGTGTISLTSASAKTFAGGGIQTYPTINQGGTGTLTITGSNKFADITNTAIGRVQFSGSATNEFTAFNLNGAPGNLLQLGATSFAQTILKAPSWNVGANSTDAGNNTGLTFSAGSVDYLSISYVNGEIVAGPTSSIYYGATNVTAIYYGSTPVSAIYYGATQVY